MINIDIIKKHKQIKALELKIFNTLTDQQIPIQLSQNESITDPAKFAKGSARAFFSSCPWEQKTVKRHFETLGITVTEDNRG